MTEILVQATNVEKKYCKSLKRGLRYGTADIARSFFGLAKNTEHLRPDEFWSLREVNFQVRRGECLGLIGPNGSGKSTLLKILNGIIHPDKGSVSITGRVGALIEVGAGFHPVLTGRENIFINGAILGFTRHEIERRFDAIVAFSELHDFIDMPVKHYSSGMYVRLGFAVAVQMEPDVLLIDEILAVGDAGFRSKCYNAIAGMRERCAIIFVSHSMSAIGRMSDRVMLLDQGISRSFDSAIDAIAAYQHLFYKPAEKEFRLGDSPVEIRSIVLSSENAKDCEHFQQGSPLIADLEIHPHKDINEVCVDLVFTSTSDDIIAECNTLGADFCLNLHSGKPISLRVRIPELSLNAGVYKLSALVLSKDMMLHHEWLKDFAVIHVSAGFLGSAGSQFKASWEVKPTTPSL